MKRVNWKSLRRKPKRKGPVVAPIWPILAVLGLVAAATFWYVRFGPNGVQIGQAPLTRLAADNLSLLHGAFNQASDRSRVIVMLSPT